MFHFIVTAAEEAIEGTGDKNRGAVRIDGIDIADVNLKWWRSKLGYVSQVRCAGASVWIACIELV